MGGASAAGVLALALALNSAPPTTTDAFVPVANDVSTGDQLAPTGQPPAPADDGGGSATKKVVETIYVLPAPKPAVVHTGKPAGNGDAPNATQRPSRDNGGRDNAGDENEGQGETSDDQAGEDHHEGGDQPDGGSGSGREPGDD
jgi:hypothetical protein